MDAGALRSTLRLARFSIVAACLAVLPQRGSAVNGIELDIGDVSGTGWNAHAISIALELNEKGIELARITAAQVSLSEATGPLRNVTIVCRRPIVKPPQFQCRGARLDGFFGKLGRQNFRADLNYRSDDGSLTFATQGLKLAGARIDVDGQWRESGARIHLNVKELTANNAAGTLATEKLSFELNAALTPIASKNTEKDWQIDATVRSSSGQAYADPVFVDFANHGLTAHFKGRWLTTASSLQIDKLDFKQKSVTQGSASGKIALGEKAAIQNLAIELASLEFPGAYLTLLQPFLLDTEFKELETSGRLSGKVCIANHAPAALDLALENVTAKDKAGKLGIRELHGRLTWLSSAQSTNTQIANLQAPSHLTWKGANAYGLTGGSARIDFTAAGANFRLLKPTRLPVLDGGLAIETLDIRDFGAENMSVRFNGELRPISMALLSKAFGWPEFSGQIQGRIPQVTYDNKILSVGGDLEAQVFGGNVTVNGLQLRNPLSNYPRLNANIALRNLDLEAVTGTFSFGTITGHLNGDIRSLELFRWAPVRMDLHLYTPPNDKSKHLISQRAVNNLSNIGGGGGGVAAALQGGVLRFFDNFRYNRLGISCRLANDICQMNGVEPAAGNSYYIVKGKGIPRIDIIGNARQVDWQRLVGQLKAIQSSGGPVIR